MINCEPEGLFYGQMVETRLWFLTIAKYDINDGLHMLVYFYVAKIRGDEFFMINN